MSDFVLLFPIIGPFYIDACEHRLGYSGMYCYNVSRFNRCCCFHILIDTQRCRVLFCLVLWYTIECSGVLSVCAVFCLSQGIYKSNSVLLCPEEFCCRQYCSYKCLVFDAIVLSCLLFSSVHAPKMAISSKIDCSSVSVEYLF